MLEYSFGGKNNYGICTKNETHSFQILCFVLLLGNQWSGFSVSRADNSPDSAGDSRIY